MLATTILTVSVLLQFAAAAMAVQLIRLTGLFWTSFSLAAAVTLMGIRRSITLVRVLTDPSGATPDLAAELVALLISIFMVTGIARIGPLFFSSKRAEQIRRVAEEKFRELADSTWDGCLLHDIKGRIVDANTALCQALGYARAELIGREMAEVEPDWTPDRIGELVRRRHAEGARESRAVLRRRDGKSVALRIRGGLVGGHEQQLFLAVLRPMEVAVPAARG